jgi:hypothetical protein
MKVQLGLGQTGDEVRGHGNHCMQRNGCKAWTWEADV